MKPLEERRILLIHPLGYEKGSARHDISRIANIMPPLGLAGIAAYLERRGMDVTIIDCFARPDSDRVVRDHLRDKRPAFVGLSCTTSSFLDGVRIARLSKDALPGVRVIFGGPHVSALKEESMRRFPVIDTVVTGEGEQSLTEVMEGLGDGREPVPGTICRLGGEIVSSSEQRPLLELDSLPFPAYEKLEGYPQSYRLPIFNYPRVPNSSCLSSRGCPYACSYCDRSVFGRSFRYNSAQYLYDHLLYLKERFAIEHVNFYDDQFTFNRQRVVDFSRMMIDRPLAMTFNCAVRSDHVDEDLLRLMKAAGCWMISLGIETGDGDLLAMHRQKADLGELGEKIRLISRIGIRTKGLFMLGLPGETEKTVKKSIAYMRSLPIDDINVSVFTPFPGSPLYAQARQLGEFDEDWEKMDCMHFQFVPQGMTRETMNELFLSFYRSHFRRARTLLNYAAMVWRSPDSWMRFLGHLSEFAKFARTNSRIISEG